MVSDNLGRPTIFLVQDGENPSSDFFIRPYVFHKSVVKMHFDELPKLEAFDRSEVVFVRYVPPLWKKFVSDNQDRISEINFFMDDDLFDFKATKGMPLRYRWKLFNLAWRHQGWLKEIDAQLWVSTPYLVEKYASWKPVLLQPKATRAQTETVTTLFYHGSASHYDEIEWLYPIVAEVLERAPLLVFEIIGNQKVRKLFANLPRVHVLHSMKWPAYQALLQRPGRTIGLAPLLDSPFNRARSHTKFFDITQAGAVGIYAPGAIYERIVRHGDNGLLVPMDKAAWVEAILQLAGDEAYRARLLQGARNSL
ncbi:glycosyltransferase family 1 protein [Marinobacterium sedimentorum]|uniref:glycosyltransferase family 1 protein n=1 Tax=Marinobacterium sedimentorum TaxID=2927804 RepID=UPI0020C6CBD0|nr:glycosyltransferase family 1 protein [Marinobacterium sedimentorum]MCP8688674.1 glycosyltransferase family 1 protein [Marinobacterium sedimentorum]